jgi:hypothetical protein
MLFGDFRAKVTLHLIATREIVKPFQYLYILRYISNKGLTGPQTQLLNARCIPCNL